MTDRFTIDAVSEAQLFDAQGYDPDTGCPTIPQSRWDADLLGAQFELDADALHNLDVRRGLDRLADAILDDFLSAEEAQQLVDDGLDECPWELVDGKRAFTVSGVVDHLSCDPQEVLQLVRSEGPAYTPSFRGSRDDDLRDVLARLDYADATDRTGVEAYEQPVTSFDDPRGVADEVLDEAFANLHPDMLVPLLKRLVQLECGGLSIQTRARMARAKLDAAERERCLAEDASAEDRQWALAERRRIARQLSDTTRVVCGSMPLRPDTAATSWRYWRLLRQSGQHLDAHRAVMTQGPAGPQRPAGGGGLIPTTRWVTAWEAAQQLHQRPTMEAWASGRLPDNPRLECWLDTQELKLRDGYWLHLPRTLQLCRVGYTRTQDPGLRRRCRRLGEQCKQRYWQQFAPLGRYGLAWRSPEWLLVCLIAASWTGHRHTPSFSKGEDVIARERETQLTRLRAYWRQHPDDPAKRRWAERKAQEILNAT